MIGTHEMAEKYIARGWQPVPLPAKCKGPQRRNWQRGGFTVEDFDPQGNIGLLLGDAGAGLVDVDIDCDEAIEAAPDFLPATGWRFGRESRPASHWVYRVGDPGKTQKWKDDDGCLLELRATGSQTMAPPSTHPSGEAVRDDVSGDPAEVSLEELHDACNRLAGWARTRRFFKREPLHKFLIEPERRDDDAERYVRSALDGEAAKVRAAAKGTRNDTLNTAALKLGHYVGSGYLDEGDAVDALADAARDCGLPQAEAAATIESGLSAGIVDPKTPPERADDWRENPRPERGARRLIARRLGDIELSPPDWLLQGILERDTLSLIFGDPGCGKTFLALDWACRIATGTPYRGHEVTQGPVVYIAGEGRQGLARRGRAWSIANNVTIVGADILTFPAIAANDAMERAELVAAVEAETANAAPAIVVVDTLARCFGGGDENSTQDMSAFVRGCDALRERWGCAVLVVHHSGHGDKKRARGAIALKAALDAEYRLEQTEGGGLLLTATKMKDAEIPAPLALDLATVPLPDVLDDFGNVVTSAAIDVLDADLSAIVAQGQNAKDGGRHGKWQPIAEQIVQNLKAESDGGDVARSEFIEKATLAGMSRATQYRYWNELKPDNEQS
jgi:hypothetical protein